MPDEVAHRFKPQIALEQIRRPLGNGIRVAAWTFDEHYGQSYDFLDGLDQRKPPTNHILNGSPPVR